MKYTFLIVVLLLSQTAFSLVPSRRSFLEDLAITSGVAAGTFLSPQNVWAAAPITKGETENVGAQTIRFFRPKPPKILRPKLASDFAVLLMRSSYQVTDEIDIVAMDQFQRDFFLIRAAEYEPYMKDLGPGMVSQGDLTDPYYFDFISFAQYLTINRIISSNPPLVFEEQQTIDRGEDVPNEFVRKVVRRDPELTTDRLVPEHSKRVGAAILKKLDEIFGDTDSTLPKIANGSRPDVDLVKASLKQLINLFLINGFAFSGEVEIASQPSSPGSAAGSKFCLTLTSPANLWGGQSLQFQRAQLDNAYLLKTATELMRRLGYRVVSSSVKYEGNKELSYLTLQ